MNQETKQFEFVEDKGLAKTEIETKENLKLFESYFTELYIIRDKIRSDMDSGSLQVSEKTKTFINEIHRIEEHFTNIRTQIAENKYKITNNFDKQQIHKFIDDFESIAEKATPIFLNNGILDYFDGLKSNVGHEPEKKLDLIYPRFSTQAKNYFRRLKIDTSEQDNKK